MTITYDRSWRLMDDADLCRALTMHRRALLLVDQENPDPEICEATRQYLTVLIDDAEAEDARRQRCVNLGIPRDAERFAPDFLSGIKANTRLDDLLVHEAGAKLGKASTKGIRRGPCPFCKTGPESTSFVVSVGDPANQWFYCFACLTGGDCFHAIMQSWGLEFPQAVEKLARDSNTPLPEKPKPSPPASGPKKSSGLLVLRAREK